MPRLVNIDGVLLHANATACAYHCRYCQLRSARTAVLPFARYARLVRRFIDWRAANGRTDFHSLFMVPLGAALVAVVMLAVFFKPPTEGPQEA